MRGAKDIYQVTGNYKVTTLCAISAEGGIIPHLLESISRWIQCLVAYLMHTLENLTRVKSSIRQFSQTKVNQ